MRKERLLEKTGNMPVYLTDPADMRYYTGFSGEGAVIITKEKDFVLTDGRYTFNAAEEAKNCIIEEVINHKEYLEENFEKIYFQPNVLSFAEYKNFEESSCGFVPLNINFDELREIKDEEELEILRYAAAIGEKAYLEVLNHIKVGVSEKEIAAKMDYYLKMFGGEGTSFETIAISGVNTCKPHGVPGEKKIENGDFVTLDFGCRVFGYCSDMTRTVCVGFATDEMVDVYETVKLAQETAENAVTAGKEKSEIDKIARDIIEKKYKGTFKHSLGHGVGLKIHEGPNLSARAKGVLQKNNVVTVEPGIYIDNKFGVRIENTVIVGENSHESLQKCEKDLIIL